MNNLQIRLIDFADSVMTLTARMNSKSSLIGIVNQLNRSSSSIGANYSEAQSASSKKDFHNKVRIALKESREVEYWLHLLKKRVSKDPDIQKALIETEEIIKILTTIVTKTGPKT